MFLFLLRPVSVASRWSHVVSPTNLLPFVPRTESRYAAIKGGLRWGSQARTTLSTTLRQFVLYPHRYTFIKFAILLFSFQSAFFNPTLALAGINDTAAKQDETYFYYIHDDQLGSSHVLTQGKQDGSVHSGITYGEGDLLQRIEYTPFGTEKFVLNPNLKFDPRYTGQEYDIETGLYYYKARYYDPKLSRFIQPDTIVPSAKNLQAYNRYSYVVNNPLKFTDPSGHSFGSWFKKLIIPFIAALIGVALTILTAGAFAAAAGVALSQLSVGMWAVAGAIGGLVGGAISGGATGGLKGALLGAALGAAMGAATSAASSALANAGVSAVARMGIFAGIGASLSYATGGLQGLATFGAGFAGGLAGGAIGKGLVKGMSPGRQLSSGYEKKGFHFEYGRDEMGPWLADASGAMGDEAVMSDAGNYGWVRPEGHRYVVGREKFFIEAFRPEEGSIVRFIENYGPAGHTFGTNHDAFVDYMTKGLGVPDLIANFPSMPGIYIESVRQEFNNSIVNTLNRILDINLEIPYRHSANVHP